MKRIDKVTLQFEIEEQRKGDALKEINEELRKQIEIVDDLEKQKREAEKKYAGNPEADELKRINSLYEQELKKLSDLDKKKSEHINSTKAQTLSLSQLQQELKTYNNILAHLTPGSKAFGDTQEYVNKLKERIKELRSGVTATEDGILKFADNWNKVAFAFTNIFNVKDKIVGVFRAVTSYLDPMAEMAMEAEGVEQAFRRIDQPGLLDNLRQATHGTVNDLELMKQAVKFKDFNLPVDQLGTYLAFAQQKAKDTTETEGQIIDATIAEAKRKQADADNAQQKQKNDQQEQLRALDEGYTGDGDSREVAGVIPVHRREFVINHQALRIPAIQRVADIIDGAQQRRNYNIQDTTRQLRQALLPPEAGLAQGGYNTKTAGTQEAPAANSPYGNSIAPLLEENNRLLERFLASGLTILQLRREIRKQERLEQNVSR